ncbi:MAG: hypothetical protein ACYC63_21075 [Armatimonadota bacterium]
MDFSNPRIAKWIEMYGSEISAEQMSLALGAGDTQVDEGGTTFYSLRESIWTNRGIIHPIIVNRETDGKLLVIEGNTRTLIYRDFAAQKREGDWSCIPALVYDDLTPTDVDAIRLQSHLVGPRAWDPYSKAKYLRHLRSSEHLTLDQVVDFCGGQKKEVIQYIDAYEDMETFYRPLCESDDEFETNRFSSFKELQNGRIQNALLEHDFTKSDFARWVKDGLLNPQNLVRRLPGILQNPKSRSVFLEDGAEQALKVLDVPVVDDNLKDAAFPALVAALRQRILNMRYEELQTLRAEESADMRELVLQARDLLADLSSDFAHLE